MDIIRSLLRVIFVLFITTSVLIFECIGFDFEKGKEEGQIDSEEVWTSAGFKEVSSPELGFLIRVPGNMKVDDSLMPAFIRISNKDLDIKISRELSPYKDIDGYFNVYLYKYLLDPEYRNANNIDLMTDGYRDINGARTRIMSFSREPASASKEKQDFYTHGLYITGEKEFYSCFIRSSSSAVQAEAVQQILSSFRKTEASGEARFNIALKPELPGWNKETAAFYKELTTSKGIKWGIFYPNSITKDFSRIEAIEKQLEYNFPITLHYIYLGHQFPDEGMKEAHKRGKTVELTMQVMWNVIPGNTEHEKKNINFDVIDGLYDDYLRSFAREAKAFGHPFIFRLNNEMNSTWVRYSGIALLCDPDVYIKVWRHIYGIFEEEGVTNAIWVFNPNDVDYPPLNWNSHISYYPGDKYVHMIGLTGYNTGTYYKETTQENWRSFTQIYDPLTEKYSKFYGDFPWMITEFACSSVGGDKEKWIREMFDNIGRYDNLKAAVWWSYVDYDYSRGKENAVPARKYWLDEKPEYLKAFKEGLEE